MKTCTKCKQQKPLTCFSKDSQKKDGLCSSCKECKKAYDKKYVQDNKQEKYAKNKTWRESHKEEKASYDKQRREKHRDEINSKKRDYYHNKGGKELSKIWRDNNRELVRSYCHNGKAKRRSKLKEFTLSHKELTEWKLQQDKICAYCSCECDDNYDIDHVIPLTKGGEHSLVNLVIACPSCNRSKGNKTLEEWNATKKELIEAKDKKPW